MMKGDTKTATKGKHIFDDLSVLLVLLRIERFTIFEIHSCADVYSMFYLQPMHNFPSKVMVVKLIEY